MNHPATLESNKVFGTIPRVDDCADAFSRDVYPILGVPIDAIDMGATVGRMEAAALAGTPLLISTVNLNFLVASQNDEDFRESLLASDLCVADGMPVLWIARLLGVPIRARVAGSDLLRALEQAGSHEAAPFSVFFFGGQEGIAERACQRMNAKAGRLSCVGALGPGFGSLEEMSSDTHIQAINDSKADFLVVALGARKGQAWLRRNHARVNVPVRSHLGATINFLAGTVKRAPIAWQRLGLEWLWRIKEEPQLAGRYWHDGLALLRLLVTRILPLAVLLRWNRFRHSRTGDRFACERRRGDSTTRLVMSGTATATAANADELRSTFRQAIVDQKPVILDLAGLKFADLLFFGLVLVLKQQLTAIGLGLRLANLSSSMARVVRLSSLECLLSGDAHSHRRAGPVSDRG